MYWLECKNQAIYKQNKINVCCYAQLIISLRKGNSILDN